MFLSQIIRHSSVHHYPKYSIIKCSNRRLYSTLGIGGGGDGKIMDKLNVFDGETNFKLPMVTKCRKNGFDVANIRLKGGVLLLDGGVFLWDVSEFKDLKPEHFTIFKALHHKAELVIIGTGKDMKPLHKDIVEYLKRLGLQFETMNSKNASRTYNILVEEDRNVAAALLPQKPVSAREFNSPETDEDEIQVNIQ